MLLTLTIGAFAPIRPVLRESGAEPTIVPGSVARGSPDYTYRSQWWQGVRRSCWLGVDRPAGRGLCRHTLCGYAQNGWPARPGSRAETGADPTPLGGKPDPVVARMRRGQEPVSQEPLRTDRGVSSWPCWTGPVSGASGGPSTGSVDTCRAHAGCHGERMSRAVWSGCFWSTATGACAGSTGESGWRSPIRSGLQESQIRGHAHGWAFVQSLL